MNPSKPLWMKFLDAYQETSEEGISDLPASAEYVRVFEEWRNAGYPEAVKTFIIIHANTIPGRSEPLRSGGELPS